RNAWSLPILRTSTPLTPTPTPLGASHSHPHRNWEEPLNSPNYSPLRRRLESADPQHPPAVAHRHHHCRRPPHHRRARDPRRGPRTPELPQPRGVTKTSQLRSDGPERVVAIPEPRTTILSLAAPRAAAPW